MRMGGGAQQFGVDSERPALLKGLSIADVDFLGFHIFAGSQNLRADILCETQRQTVELPRALALAEDSRSRCAISTGRRLRHPVREKDEPLDLAPIGANLGSLLDDLLLSPAADARLNLELGRYLVGEAGVYVRG